MPRLRLDKYGYMERNGIRARLSDESNFGPGEATMEFNPDNWADENCYPEVLATRCNTPLEDFCMPDNSEYEIFRVDGGITIRIFTKEMPGSPVLEWIFPDPGDATEDLYKKFTEGL